MQKDGRRSEFLLEIKGNRSNILSFAKMGDKHPLRHKSKSEHAFILSLAHKEGKCLRNESGFFKPPYIESKKIRI
jgi:hypothetical protein